TLTPVPLLMRKSDITISVTDTDGQSILESFEYNLAGFALITNSLPVSPNNLAFWGDYDNDGDLDVLIINSVEGDFSQLLRNDGNGVFTSVPTGCFPTSAGTAASGDYDNDGDLDLVISGVRLGGQVATKLYRNDGDGTFTEINSGLPPEFAASVSWGDYDHDGNLDLLFVGRSITVYRGDGHGSFTNANLPLPPAGSGAWIDFD